ncbi:hypothetical protein CAEBREN_07228 [Caenorhabditis brenneri]|uniref:Uncharacterized protein n=1 Tax=Caenorhabditis brenneri TaxID=135651 RepID=G0NJ72_CAEBE|nr:hypothetical protein CAEBREN_07228 [Caenorhabditis brenneri]
MEEKEPNLEGIPQPENGDAAQSMKNLKRQFPPESKEDLEISERLKTYQRLYGKDWIEQKARDEENRRNEEKRQKEEDFQKARKDPNHFFNRIPEQPTPEEVAEMELTMFEAEELRSEDTQESGALRQNFRYIWRLWQENQPADPIHRNLQQVIESPGWNRWFKRHEIRLARRVKEHCEAIELIKARDQEIQREEVKNDLPDIPSNDTQPEPIAEQGGQFFWPENHQFLRQCVEAIYPERRDIQISHLRHMISSFRLKLNLFDPFWMRSKGNKLSDSRKDENEEIRELEQLWEENEHYLCYHLDALLQAEKQDAQEGERWDANANRWTHALSSTVASSSSNVNI